MNTLEEQADRYNLAKIRYERSLAMRDWAKAREAVDVMIGCAPCAEALPTLASMRDEVELRIRQAKPFWARLARRAS